MLGGQDTDCQRERKLPSFRIPGCKYTKPVAHTDKFKYFSIWQHYSKSPIADHLTKHNCADLFILVPGDIFGGEDEPVVPTAPLHDPQIVDCHVALPDPLQTRCVNRGR